MAEAGPAAAVSRRRIIAAGLVGNILEWYDFAVYGFFAPILAPLFFPSDDPVASLIAAYGAFAAGFLVRPFGGALFGQLGDRAGRKVALAVSVALMAVPTTLLGLLPTHVEWGIGATVALIVLRLLQGLSVGGEYTCSTVFLIEGAPANRRGFYGCWSAAGVVAGVLIGSGFGAVLHAALPESAIDGWGWRVPFLFGAVLGVIGFLARRGVASGEAPSAAGPSPVLRAFRDEWRSMLRVIGFTLVDGVGFYLIFVYLATFLIARVKVPPTEAFDINTLTMVGAFVTVPLAGALSDRVGRKPVVLFATGALAILAWPLLWLMHHPVFAMALAGQMVLGILMGLYYGASTAMAAEMFPASVRCSALSVGYNVSLAAFGGTAPMVATFLIEHTGESLSIAWYLAAAAAITFATTTRLKETRGLALQPVDATTVR